MTVFSFPKIARLGELVTVASKNRNGKVIFVQNRFYSGKNVKDIFDIIF